ncbi:MAG: hypothetical protein GX585_05490 [Clostridiales bacterium]|nr:hypothetical protein [Clostridiales bacterium]
MTRQFSCRIPDGGAAGQRAMAWFAGVAVAVCLAGLLPLLRAGFYAHPFGDDYAFAVFLNDARRTGASPLGALWYTIKRYYFGWQGTYAGVAGMALVPVDAYWLTPFVMAGGLILSTGKLLHTLICRRAGGDKSAWLLISAVLLFLTLQCMPGPAQGLYWWNGAMFYTFFYCLMLLLVDRLLVFAALRQGRYRWVVLAEALLLAALAAGGNYVTALLTVGVLWLHVLLLLRRDRRRWPLGLLPALTATAGFLFSALAPGNGVRQDMSEGSAPLAAALISLRQGAGDLRDFMTPLTAVLLLLLAPLLWRLCARLDFSFRWPLGVLVFTFLVFSAQNTPHFYALSTAGPLRLRNIVYYSYLWFLLLNECYLLGWLQRRRGGVPPGALPRCWGAPTLLLVLALTAQFPSLTAVQCASAYSNGSLAAYDRALSAREALLRDPAVSRVTYAPLAEHPALFFVYPLDAGDPEDFVNVAARNYYHKESVAMQP